MDALASLRSKLSQPCQACVSLLNKVGSSYSKTDFYNYLSRKPRFFDGTKSNLRLGNLCGRAAGVLGFLDWVLCAPPPLPFTCPSSTSTVSQYMACTKGGAVSETPTQSGMGLLTFFDPAVVYSSPASTPTGIVNQALIFHEALHGFTGVSDIPLLEDFGYVPGTNYPSCKITDYIELNIWAGTVGTCGP